MRKGTFNPNSASFQSDLAEARRERRRQRQERKQMQADVAKQFHSQIKEMGKLVRDIIVTMDETRDMGAGDIDWGHLGTLNAAQIDIENALSKLKQLKG